jgi:DNA-binding NarL/FixJ family response regulator
VTTRVLIADDHTLVAEGLRYIVQAEPDLEFVGLARDGQEAVRMAKGEKVEGTSTVDNGMKKVPAILFNPTAVHKGLVDQILLREKFHTREQVYGSAAPK